MKQGYEDIQDIPTYERKWIIDRFIDQKKKEEESLNKSKGSHGPPNHRRMPGREN